MIRQAIVLVGGLGTRLGPLTKETPKPLLNVGGQPFLARLLGELVRQGVADILLLAGFRGEQIEALSAQVPNARVIVEPEPLGTGGALKFSQSELAEQFFLLNGDSLFDINLWDLAEFAGAGNAIALRAVDDVSRFGPAVLEGDLITRFSEREERARPGLINGGVSILSRRTLDLVPPNVPVSLEAKVYPSLAANGQLRGRRYDRPFLDIGVPEDFARAQSWVPRVLDRPGVVFELDDTLDRLTADAVHWRPGAVARIKAVNDAGLLALVEAPGGALRPDHLSIFNADLTQRGAHLDGWMARDGRMTRDHLQAAAPAFAAPPQVMRWSEVGDASRLASHPGPDPQ